MFNVNLVDVEATYKKYNCLLLDRTNMTVACLCDRKVVQLEHDYDYYKADEVPWGTTWAEEKRLRDTDPKYQYVNYTCPNCGEEHVVAYCNRSIDIPVSYVIFDDSEEQGKLKEVLLKKSYVLKNGIVVKRTVSERLVMNLDTGMTYSLPTYVDGKKPKRGRHAKDNKSVMNVTYKMHFFERISGLHFKLSKRSVKLALYYKILNYKKEKFGIEFYNNPLINKIGLPTNSVVKLDTQYDFCTTGSKRSKGAFCADFRDTATLRPAYQTMVENLNTIDLSILNRYPSLYVESFAQIGSDVSARSLIQNDLFKVIKHNDTFNMRTLKERGLFINKSAKKYFSENINKGLYYSSLGKILTKTDNIEKIINQCKNRDYDNYTLNKVIEFLRLYKWKYKKDFKKNENSIVNHVIKATNSNNYEPMDALNMFVKNVTKVDFKFNFRNITNTHDRLAALDNLRRNKRKNEEIEYLKVEQKLNFDAGIINFTLAKDTKELLHVGGHMGICVGSYGDVAVNKGCLILVGYKEDVPFICIELTADRKKVKQFKFKRNQHLEKVVEKLNEEEKDSITRLFIHLQAQGVESADYDLSYASIKDFTSSQSIVKSFEILAIKEKARKRKKKKDNLLELRREIRKRRKNGTKRKRKVPAMATRAHRPRVVNLDEEVEIVEAVPVLNFETLDDILG